MFLVRELPELLPPVTGVNKFAKETSNEDITTAIPNKTPILLFNL